MKRLLLGALVALTLAPAVVAAEPDCVPIPGVEAIWADPHTQFVLVGEMHGTEDTPGIFADLVCAASKTGRPIVVGLEFSMAEQPGLDAYLASFGDTAAQADLRKRGPWMYPTQDGRGSRAMFLLVERLRSMKAAGVIEEVVAFAPSDWQGPQAHEQGMADAWQAMAQRRPNTLVVVLVGNVHAMKAPGGARLDYKLAGMLVPADQTVSLRVAPHGGEAWNRQKGEGRARPLSSEDAGPRRVELKPVMQGAYDGVLATGKATAASPPAVQPPPQA